MKKNIVCGALLNLICIQVYAVQTPDTISEKISISAKSHRGVQQAETTRQKKSNSATKNPQSIEINCDYRISGDTQIDKAFIVGWAEYAVLHSFNFDFPSVDAQLKNLRTCYTQNGWISFMNALNDSGNINSIKTQNLIVSSILDGKVHVIDDHENQWKITVPIKVFYKNDKEEITHFLNVYIIISWRNAFKLGIVQMITTPRIATLSLKRSTTRDALESISLSVTTQINNAENLKKLVTSFLNSSFIASRTSFSETDRILGHPEMSLKLEYDITKQLQQLVEEPTVQPLHDEKTITLTTNLISHLYKSVTHQINNAENLKKKVTSFLDSLIIASKTSFLEMDRILSPAEVCLKLEYDITGQLQHLIEEQREQALHYEKAITQIANLISQYYKNKIENALKTNWIEGTMNQFLSIKSDIFATKLPNLLAYFKEKETVKFYVALPKIDKMKMLNTLNYISQQREKKPQFAENKNNQRPSSLPMQESHQKVKNQITHLLNLNLTLGKKISGEFVILQMKTNPSVIPSFSNRAETLVANANSLSNRVDSTQQIQQLVQKPSKIPKITFNRQSDQSKGAEIINCDYKIPSEMTKINEDLVIKWAEHAVTQSFDFNSVSIETQLQKLVSCYTAKGWENFKNALDKSGNIEAIKSQNLIMSSKVNGQITLIRTKNNQWNIELPLQVIYQNEQVKVTQFLDVNLTMERKLTSEFGIMQIIATLKTPVNTNTLTQSQSQVIPSNEQALQNTQQSTVEQLKKADLINCDYKIPAETKTINQGIILAWAEHAVIKSFNFDSKSIDSQLEQLQSCYTKQGWEKFINAIEKSGNIKTFKTKQLSATSQIDGVPQLIESRDNQWTLTLPLKINYQFKNGNVTQLLKVDLTIGRKITGYLGIIRLNSKLRIASS